MVRLSCLLCVHGPRVVPIVVQKQIDGKKKGGKKYVVDLRTGNPYRMVVPDMPHGIDVSRDSNKHDHIDLLLLRLAVVVPPEMFLNS